MEIFFQLQNILKIFYIALLTVSFFPKYKNFLTFVRYIAFWFFNLGEKIFNSKKFIIFDLSHTFHQICCTILVSLQFCLSTKFFRQFFQLSNFLQYHIFINIFLIYKISFQQRISQELYNSLTRNNIYKNIVLEKICKLEKLSKKFGTEVKL